jgi:hypothetical protein
VVQGGGRFLDDCMSGDRVVVFVLFVFGGRNGDKFLHADGSGTFLSFQV